MPRTLKAMVGRFSMTPGTLRYGLSNLTAPRTIVFDISGVFSLAL